MSEQKSVALVFVVAMFIDIMDGTIVNTALPAIGNDFHHGSPTDLSWIVLGYLMSLAIWIPASGWLGDRFGTKKIFLFALAMFTGASALCGLATSIDQLTFFRFLQGIGGGMMTPVGTTMLYRVYPPHQRQRAGSLLAIPTLLAPATGPVLGGWITDTWSWRWIFYVNVPLGLAAFAFGLWRLKEHQHHAENRFDPTGFVLSAVSLSAILYGLNRVEVAGWGSPQVQTSLIAGLIAGVVLVFTQSRIKDPLLALRLFRDRTFTLTNIISAFSTASFFGLILVMPLMLQGVRHLSPSMSGLTTFPQALGVMMMSPLSRIVYPKIGPRRMLVVGLTLAGGIMLLLLDTNVTSNLWVYRAILFGRGLCWAFIFSPLQAAAFSQISLPDTGRASALYSTQRQVASSIGVAVLISLLMTQINHVKASLSTIPQAAQAAHLYNAYKVPFLATCLFAFGGAFFSLFLDDEKILSVFRQRAAQQAAASTNESPSS